MFGVDAAYHDAGTEARRVLQCADVEAEVAVDVGVVADEVARHLVPLPRRVVEGLRVTVLQRRRHTLVGEERPVLLNRDAAVAEELVQLLDAAPRRVLLEALEESK